MKSTEEIEWHSCECAYQAECAIVTLARMTAGPWIYSGLQGNHTYPTHIWMYSDILHQNNTAAGTSSELQQCPVQRKLVYIFITCQKKKVYDMFYLVDIGDITEDDMKQYNSQELRNELTMVFDNKPSLNLPGVILRNHGKQSLNYFGRTIIRTRIRVQSFTTTIPTRSER